jgi:hypothetical protein
MRVAGPSSPLACHECIRYLVRRRIGGVVARADESLGSDEPALSARCPAVVLRASATLGSRTPPAPQSRLGTGACPAPNHAGNRRNLRYRALRGRCLHPRIAARFRPPYAAPSYSSPREIARERGTLSWPRPVLPHRATAGRGERQAQRGQPGGVAARSTRPGHRVGERLCQHRARRRPDHGSRLRRHRPLRVRVQEA